MNIALLFEVLHLQRIMASRLSGRLTLSEVRRNGKLHLFIEKELA